MHDHVHSRLLSGLVVAGLLTLPSLGFAASAPATTATTTTVTTTASVAKVAAPTSNTDKLSYTIGVDMGNSLKAQQLDINPDMLAQGIKDAIGGSPLLLTK